MGEAKRRRARMGMGHNELGKALQRLHEQTNGRICFDVRISRPEYAIAAYLKEGPDALRDLEFVVQFAKLVKSGRRPRCLGCEHEFRPGAPPPAAFSRCTPFGGEPGSGMMVGICAECAQMPDEKLLEITAGWLRRLGMTEVAAGTS